MLQISLETIPPELSRTDPPPNSVNLQRYTTFYPVFMTLICPNLLNHSGKETMHINTPSVKKQDTLVLPITSPNVD